MTLPVEYDIKSSSQVQEYHGQTALMSVTVTAGNQACPQVTQKTVTDIHMTEA